MCQAARTGERPPLLRGCHWNPCRPGGRLPLAAGAQNPVMGSLRTDIALDGPTRTNRKEDLTVKGAGASRCAAKLLHCWPNSSLQLLPQGCKTGRCRKLAGAVNPRTVSHQGNVQVTSGWHAASCACLFGELRVVQPCITSHWFADSAFLMTVSPFPTGLIFTEYSFKIAPSSSKYLPSEQEPDSMRRPPASSFHLPVETRCTEQPAAQLLKLDEAILA